MADRGRRAGDRLRGVDLRVHPRIWWRSAFIDELFLRASHRGQGIGTRVIRYALSRCVELGIRAVRLEVLRHNPDALRLYTRLGFEVHDRYLLTHHENATGAPAR